MTMAAFILIVLILVGVSLTWIAIDEEKYKE